MDTRTPENREDEQTFLDCLNRVAVVGALLESLVNQHLESKRAEPGIHEVRLLDVGPHAVAAMEMLLASLCPVIEGWRKKIGRYVEHPEIKAQLRNHAFVRQLFDHRDAIWHFTSHREARVEAMRLNKPLQAWAVELSKLFNRVPPLLNGGVRPFPLGKDPPQA